MIDKRLLLSNVSAAFVSQGVVLLSSLVAALALPKFLGVSEFGYWQLFSLYAAYSGLLHLGLNDGIYLVQGGKTRQTVDRSDVTAQFIVSVFIQIALATLVICVTYLLDLDEVRRFVLIMFAVYTLLYNSTAFLGFTFQALNETKAYSFAMAVSRLVFISLVVAIMFSQTVTFQWVIGCFVAGQGAALVFAVIYARGALFGGPIDLRAGLRNAGYSIQVGWWLTVANLASLLLLGTVRFVVDARWDIDTFATISLLILLVTFVLQFVSQVSMVLFPALRQVSRTQAVRLFARMNRFLGRLSPVIYTLYFPAYLAIHWWLPDYRDGLKYLAVIFPLAVINTNIDLGCSTFMKVLRQERVMFVVNVISLVLLIAAACIMAFVFGSIWGVLVAQYVIVLLRWCATDWILRARLGVPRSKLMLSNVLVSVVFVCVVTLAPFLQGLIFWLLILSIFLTVNVLVSRNRAPRSH